MLKPALLPSPLPFSSSSLACPFAPLHATPTNTHSPILKKPLSWNLPGSCRIVHGVHEQLLRAHVGSHIAGIEEAWKTALQENCLQNITETPTRNEVATLSLSPLTGRVLWDPRSLA